jgi:hypothetical protein
VVDPSSVVLTGSQLLFFVRSRGKPAFNFALADMYPLSAEDVSKGEVEGGLASRTYKEEQLATGQNHAPASPFEKKDRPPISSLKITKVGLLSRKEDLVEGGRKAPNMSARAKLKAGLPRERTKKSSWLPVKTTLQPRHYHRSRA